MIPESYQFIQIFILQSNIHYMYDINIYHNIIRSFNIKYIILCNTHNIKDHSKILPFQEQQTYLSH